MIQCIDSAAHINSSASSRGKTPKNSRSFPAYSFSSCFLFWSVFICSYNKKNTFSGRFSNKFFFTYLSNSYPTMLSYLKSAPMETTNLSFCFKSVFTIYFFSQLIPVNDNPVFFLFKFPHSGKLHIYTLIFLTPLYRMLLSTSNCPKFNTASEIRNP